MQPGMVAHTYGPCTKEAEEEGHFSDQPGLGEVGKEVVHGLVWFVFLRQGLAV